MKSKYYLFIILTLILAAILIPNITSAGSVKLSWLPNTENDIAKYKVYYGIASRDYGSPIDVGNITEYTVINLEDGIKYYFAVSAVDTSLNESGFSQEISKQVGLVPVPPLPGEPLVTNLSVASGEEYQIVSGLTSDAQAYFDNTKYKYTNVPAELEGAVYLQSSHGDMRERDNDSFLSFDLNRDATVFIVVDDRHRGLPAGTEGFVDTGYDFKYYSTMSVYKKHFTAGRLTFGTVTMGDMYTLLFIEDEVVVPDTTKPEISILQPTSSGEYVTGLSTVALSGSASDNIEISQVSWSSSRGGSGIASGTTSWSISNLDLYDGENIFTIKAKDSSGNESSASLTVTYNPPDVTKPAVSIVLPTSGEQFESAVNVITISGTASDNKEVANISWQSDTGLSGVASGTDNWNITGIQLQEGDNLITVTGTDSSDNTSSAQLLVNYTKPIIVPVPEGLITDISTASGEEYKIQYGLTSNSQAYFDRTKYIYTNIPAELEGAVYLQSSHGDMAERGNDSFLSFNLNKSATLYVVVDDRHKGLPAGMEGFVDTGYDFKFYTTMSVYKKHFSSGKLTFGTVTMGDMYTILFVEDEEIIPLPAEELITDLDVTTGRSYSIKAGLESGAQAYSDRTTYLYLNVPAELESAAYIQTAHRDSYAKGYNNLLSFNLNREASVYVILDDLNSSMPVGMEDFTDTGSDFKFYRNMSIYMKTFSAGRVTFGSNSKGDMYTILVVEK